MCKSKIIGDIEKIINIRKKVYSFLDLTGYENVNNFKDIINFENTYENVIRDNQFILLNDEKLLSSIWKIIIDYHTNYNIEVDCLKLIVIGIAEGDNMTIQLLTDELGNLIGEEINDILEYIKSI